MKKFKTLKHYLMSGLLVISLTILPAPKTAEATGFPVVDLAGVVQMIIDFVIQIAHQAEAITTAVNSGLSVVEQIKEYTQMIEEYKTTLNNLRDLSEAISDGDFDAAYGLLSNSNLTEFVNMDLLNMSEGMLDIWTAVDDARRGDYGGARAIEDILGEANDLFGDNPEAIELIELSQNRQSITTSGAAISDVQLRQIDGFEDKVREQQTMIAGLGGETEIATLQALAQIMVFQNQMKVSEMRHDTARRKGDLSMSEIYSRNMAKAVDDNIVNSKIAINNDVVYLNDN